MAQKSKAFSQRATSKSEGWTWFRKLSTTQKDLLCLGILFALVYMLFWNIIVKDMVISDSGDTAAHQAWAKAIEHIHQTEHISALWIPYIFSGMPIAGALIFPRDVNYAELLIQIPGKLLFLRAEFSWFVLHYFLMGVFLFLLARYLNFSQLPSLIAAMTMMLNPYAIGLAQIGHGSKLVTLSYVPLLFLTAHMMFQRRDLLSVGLFAAVLGTTLLSRHPQIAFYGLLIVGCYLIYEVVLDIKQNLPMVTKKVALFVLAGAIGFAMYAYEFIPTNEYTQYSIRGGGTAGTAGGLTYDYATNWSFHPFEILNYLVPSFFGFASPYYWGWMPFTDATVYIGIVPIVLGLLALIYKRGRETWFLLLLSILVLFISFGKHLPLVYDLLFNYFPYFNKFRAPSMILHLIPFAFGLLAAFGFTGLSEFRDKASQQDIMQLKKRLTFAAGILGAILVLGFLANETLYSTLSGFMFEKEGDMQQLQQQYGAQAAQVFARLKRLRFDLLWKDYVKFAIIAGAVLTFIILYLKRNMSATTLGLGLLVALTIDLAIIDTKFINPKPQSDLERTFAPDATVQFLKSDTSLYRIYPIGGLFQDNSWMYHTIQSISGYSPAKLKVYQEMIDSVGLHPPRFPLNMAVLNMLNAKYIVVPGRLPDTALSLVFFDQQKSLVTYYNPNYLPRAWFADTVVVAENRWKLFRLLNSPTFNPRSTAILEKPPTVQSTKSESTSVQVIQHGAHEISFKTYSSRQSLLVVSEVFYPAGWKASVDGTETEIYKTNSILRSVVVPSGEHTVEFTFDPSSYRTGLSITNVAWIITALLVLTGTVRHPSVREWLARKKKGAAISTT